MTVHRNVCLLWAINCLWQIIKRTPAQSTKMRLCAFRESTFIEEQMYAVPICEHGCAT